VFTPVYDLFLLLVYVKTSVFLNDSKMDFVEKEVRFLNKLFRIYIIANSCLQVLAIIQKSLRSFLQKARFLF